MMILPKRVPALCMVLLLLRSTTSWPTFPFSSISSSWARIFWRGWPLRPMLLQGHPAVFHGETKAGTFTQLSRKLSCTVRGHVAQSELHQRPMHNGFNVGKPYSIYLRGTIWFQERLHGLIGCRLGRNSKGCSG